MQTIMAEQKSKLHLVEPTLFDQTGHGFSYTTGLLLANQGLFDIHVWIDQRGKNLLTNFVCTVHNFFTRRWRQAQKIFLYAYLMRQPDYIFINTSELWDLRLLAYFSRCKWAQAKPILHFHQFRSRPNKIAILRKIAANIADIAIFVPTQRLQSFFLQQGFTNCHVIACPSFIQNVDFTQANLGKFDKILYAGAARSDKGFARIVNLLAYSRSIGDQTVFSVQVSPPNSLRYDQETSHALQILASLPTHNLILHRHTLSQAEYLKSFQNSICILAYDQQEYSDKFSGIALDSLCAGCPIITAHNTWMGDVVEHYQAGITLSTYNDQTIWYAFCKIRDNYAQYQQCAIKAAQTLAVAHHPRNTLLLIDGQ